MAVKFTETDGKTVVTKLTLHAHRHRRLHLAGVGAVRKDVTVTSSDKNVIEATHLSLFDGPHGIFTVDFAVGTPGQATVEATHGSDTVTLPVTVVARIALPGAATETGALVRLLLAESASPLAYTAADIKLAMQYMRVVLQNRTKNPAHYGGTAGQNRVVDIIKASNPVQFAGFQNYPHLGRDQQSVIDADVRIANDDDDARQSKYADHIKMAEEVATQPVMKDPCSSGLTGWYTHGMGNPGSGFKFWKLVAGTDFYTE